MKVRGGEGKERREEGNREGRRENLAIMSLVNSSFFLRVGVRGQTRKGVGKEEQKRWGKRRDQGRGRM